MMNPIKNFENFFSNIFLISLSLVITFFVSEMAFRYFYKFTPFQGTYEITDQIHQPRPYVEAVAAPNLEGINSLGYKGDLPELPKPEGEFRVAVLGGSTVFGHEPNFEKMTGEMSLPHYLEKELQKQVGSHVRVYNFGITSTVVQQELARTVMDVITFKPDLILSYGGGNDYLNPHSVGYPHRYVYHEVNPLWITDVSEYPAFRLFFFGSLLVRTLFRTYYEGYFERLRKPRHYDAKNAPFYSVPEINYVESLYRMQVISQAFGAKFAAFFQPLRIFYQGSEPEKRDLAQYNNNIQKAVKAKKVKHFQNLFDVFKNDSTSVWTDEIHLTDSANKKIAQYLAQQLKTFIKKGPHQ